MKPFISAIVLLVFALLAVAALLEGVCRLRCFSRQRIRDA